MASRTDSDTERLIQRGKSEFADSGFLSCMPENIPLGICLFSPLYTKFESRGFLQRKKVFFSGGVRRCKFGDTSIFNNLIAGLNFLS